MNQWFQKYGHESVFHGLPKSGNSIDEDAFFSRSWHSIGKMGHFHAVHAERLSITPFIDSKQGLTAVFENLEINTIFIRYSQLVVISDDMEIRPKTYVSYHLFRDVVFNTGRWFKPTIWTHDIFRKGMIRYGFYSPHRASNPARDDMSEINQPCSSTTNQTTPSHKDIRLQEQLQGSLQLIYAAQIQVWKKKIVLTWKC